MGILFLIIGVIVVGAVLLVWLCVYYNKALTCEYYTVESHNIPEVFRGSKIIMLTDLHEQEYGENNEKLLKAIQKEAPDYVMIAGDLFIKGEKLREEKALCLLKQLVKRYPVYYAPGNHEEYMERLALEGEFQAYISKVKEIGVKYLANESCYIEKEQQRLRVTGLHLPKEYFRKFYQKPVELKQEELCRLVGEGEQEYQILIAHNPNFFDSYAEWGAELVLSGHVHGGVVILPLLGGMISTSFELFPKYDYGKFVKGDATMILSRGLGVHTIKLRVFNRPEISVITLK